MQCQKLKTYMETGRVVFLPARSIRPNPAQPRKIFRPEALDELSDSIRQHGILQPLSVRRSGNGYELIAGHRRREACRMAGLTTMPVLIREMDDDTATIIMVDSNRQRENLMPSEKAFAYKMRLEAVKRKAGRPSKNNLPQVAANFRSDDEVAKSMDISGDTVRRYIRLSNLVPELLQFVDDGKIAMSPAVELSYLSQEHQKILLEAMQEHDCTPVSYTHLTLPTNSRV